MPQRNHAGSMARNMNDLQRPDAFAILKLPRHLNRTRRSIQITAQNAVRKVSGPDVGVTLAAFDEWDFQLVRQNWNPPALHEFTGVRDMIAVPMRQNQARRRLTDARFNGPCDFIGIRWPRVNQRPLIFVAHQKHGDNRAAKLQFQAVNVRRDGHEDHICSMVSMPSKFKPRLSTSEVKRHNAKREVRNGSSLFKTGQAS